MSDSPLGGLLSSLPELFSDFLAACSSPPPLSRSVANAVAQQANAAAQQADAAVQQADATVQQVDATVQQADATVQQVDPTVQQVDATVQQAECGSRDKVAKKRKHDTADSSQVQRSERRRLLNSVPAKAPRPLRGARVCGTPLSVSWCSKALGHLGNCGR